jgi:hypothetical protein
MKQASAHRALMDGIAGSSTAATTNENVTCSQFMNEASRRGVVYHSVSCVDDQIRLCPCDISRLVTASNFLGDAERQSPGDAHHLPVTQTGDRQQSPKLFDLPSCSGHSSVTSTPASEKMVVSHDDVDAISINTSVEDFDIGAVCEEEEDIDDDPLSDYQRAEGRGIPLTAGALAYDAIELSSVFSSTASMVSTQPFPSPAESPTSSDSTILPLLTGTSVTLELPLVDPRYTAQKKLPPLTPDSWTPSSLSSAMSTSPSTNRFPSSPHATHKASITSPKLSSTFCRSSVSSSSFNSPIPIYHNRWQDYTPSVSPQHLTQSLPRPFLINENFFMSGCAREDTICDHVTNMPSSDTPSTSSALVTITVTLSWTEVKHFVYTFVLYVVHP